MDEDWAVLSTFFPLDWERLAESSGALKGLRKDKSAANLLQCSADASGVRPFVA